MESENPLSASYRPLAQKGYWPALALELFVEGRYAKAVDLCDRMLEQEPGVISGRVILARSLFHAGQFERARVQFVEVLKRDPKNLLALKYLGDIHYRDGEEAAAMACYRRIFEIDPHTRGVSSPVEKKEVVQTRELTVKRPEETVGGKKPQPLQEPAFVTETVGDIYREQGYFMLAGEVYRRLLVGTDNSRIAAKLKEVEDKISIKEK
jgi:tetratricopeptide (TPR) repeat protein